MPRPRSTLELLFRAARLVNEAAIARINAGGLAVRMAHTQLFPHITRDGVRLTVLAERLGVSKQAIGPLVDDLVAEGVVERLADPRDARAKLIRWTRAGQAAMLRGLAVLETLEGELAAHVGRRRMAELANTLAAIVDATSAVRSADSSAASARASRAPSASRTRPRPSSPRPRRSARAAG